ncbi:hypothetical protein HC341_15670 [Aquisalimonas sp. 2447]|uniref:YiiX/YebB-like N1pC/P60 family cysteine hydrolase n=1 Tax=Aquisalimonas sp. 2447 TaxID=2740807 RepID=UPI00143274F2|nr:YiiX/YebB-like N1pC/P60 family cysteine hydrolase [Aquisalimonas sp. 2447]QIT56508.1 hypothetical protein HC341_15670 [Aquisalimonas sp. 2447]
MDVSIDPARAGLNPGAERCISASTLEPGDIIATANPQKSSRFIQAATNAPFSHVILYRGSGRAIDAVPAGGVQRGALWELLGRSNLAAVFRSNNATRAQRELAVKWAEKQAGSPYDATGAARVAAAPGAPGYRIGLARLSLSAFDEVPAVLAVDGHDASFFCSELVFRAYEVAGAPLVDRRAHRAGPGGVLHTQSLELLGYLRGGE